MRVRTLKDLEALIDDHGDSPAHPPVSAQAR
jgi:hypothetical protein